MFFFQSPPATRFDLNFHLAGIPVSVHPLFWLLVILLGSGSGGLVPVLIWAFVVFLSILVHEMGHALAFRRYGQDSRIVLHFAGGLTIPQGISWGSGMANVSLSANQNIFISLAGPGAGFLLAGGTALIVNLLGGDIVTRWLFGIIPLPYNAVIPFGGTLLSLMFTMLLWVNLFWGFINLLPVYPLDGGQVARNVLVQFDPWGGVRKSLWLSVGTGGVLALFGFLVLGSVYMALLFAILAFQSYQMLQTRF